MATTKKPNSPTKDEERRIRKSLHYSNIEGIITSSSSSILASFITPFALALRATSAQVGLITAAQSLSRTLAQIPGAKMTEFYSRKNIWLFSRVMSRLVFGVALIMLSLAFALSWPIPSPVYILLIVVVLIYFFISLDAPAWASLIGDLVSPNIRGRYFGRRNMLIGIAGIAAVGASGYLVSMFGFWVIFTIYVVMGMLAIPVFLKIYEPPRKKIFHYKHRFEFHPMRWPASLRANKRLAIFAVYMVLMSFAVDMAGPFYAVYMLRNLSIDYTTFAFLIMLGALARILSYRYWGALNDKFSSRKIFIVCGTFAVFTPFFWMFANGPIAVAAINIFDGFIWAGFDLVAFNYLLDITPGDKRPQYVANYNFFVGIGAVFGALAGGFLSAYYSNVFLFAFTGLQLVFLTSFLVRILLLAILPRISEIDIFHSKVMPVRYVFWQAMAVEPTKGINGFIHYTFQYPFHIEKEFKKNMDKLKYKVKMMSV